VWLSRNLATLVRLTLSVALALATIAAIRSLDRLAYSDTRDAVQDALLMPGAIFGWVVSSGGVHGSSPMLWAAAAIIGNVLFYSLLWWSVLRVTSALRLRLPSNNRWRGP
jgi:hypothetical protein